MQLNTLGLQNTALDGVFLIQPERQTDLRGQSYSAFSAPHYAAFGLSTRFVADQYTRAYQGSLYGIHYATDTTMAQLFTAVRGTVFVVAVDMRPRRKTFGKSISFILNEQTQQAYFAPGIAWGYAVISETADIHQKFTALPVADQMGGIFWADADLNIQWPFKRPIVGSEEATYPSLVDAVAKLAKDATREVVVR